MRLPKTLGDRQERKLRRVLGSRFDELKVDRARTFEQLQRGGPKERYGALMMLEIFWEIPADILVPLCDNIIANDLDPHVRAQAIAIIGRSYQNSFNDGRSRVLAKIALDSAQAKIVRAFSIFALQQINEEVNGPFEHNDSGSPHRIVQRLLDKGRNMREVLDLRVDWDWVENFL